MTFNPLWRNAAKIEMGAAGEPESLAFQAGPVTCQPYYAGTSKKSVPSVLRRNPKPFMGPGGWYQLSEIILSDEKNSNALALAELKAGAHGLIFVLDREVDLDVLLGGVVMEYCFIAFKIKNVSIALLNALEVRIRKELNPKNVSGAVFTAQPESFDVRHQVFQDFPRFFSCGVYLDSNHLNELPWKDWFRTNNAGWSDRFALYVDLDTDFFHSIIRLRSARILLETLAITSGKPEAIPFLHVRELVFLIQPLSRRQTWFRPPSRLLLLYSEQLMASLFLLKMQTVNCIATSHEV